MILYFAPVHALVAVRALVLAQVHVGLFNVSSTVRSLDKLLSTLAAGISSVGSGNRFINT